MRIASSNQYDTSIQNLLQRQSDVAESEASITSGKRVSKASDDPAAAARAERALSTESRITASQRAVDNSKAQMNQSSSALHNAGDLMQTARELMVQAGNASLGDSERKSLSNQIRAIRDQLLTIANASDGGHGFLFGGQGASTAPFVDTPGGVQYQSTGGASRAADGGEGLPLTVDGQAAWMTARTGNGVFATSVVASKGAAWIDGGKVTDPSAITGATYSIQFSNASGAMTYSVLKDGAGTAQSDVPYKSGQAIAVDGMSTTVTGQPADGDTFQLAPSTPTLSVFDALDQAADNLGTANRSGSQIAQTNNTDLNSLDAVMSNVQTAEAAAGATLNRIDDVNDRLSSQMLQAQSDASDAQDLDMVSALSKQQTLQTGYDAALKTYSSVQRLSLFQYISGIDAMASVVLGQVALGYSPFVDAKRNVFATRLTVLPLRPDVAPSLPDLLAEIAAAWPEGSTTISLNVAGEALLAGLLATRLPPNLMVEIPSFFASDPDHSEAILRLHAAGTVLLIKGRPVREVPRAVLPCFKYSIVDLADERRVGTAAQAPAGIVRQIPHVQGGVRSIVDMEAAFGRGAAAVLGWPIDDEVVGTGKARGRTASADLQVIVELMQGVDREEPADRLEQILRRDPQLAFKLMRYINSPGFGLSMEVSSFGHAIRLMGYQRLKRWLALLLATASKDINLKPLMFAAVRRGMVMEEMVRSSGDVELRNDMFVCGVFSLLDHVFGVPFAELLKSIPVPPPVVQALVEGSGPLQPYLDAARAIESESLHDYRELADRLLLDVADLNLAQLRALSAAARLG